MPDDDAWPVSRRALLAGITTVGAAASGAGTAALFRDDGRTGARATAGSVDLETRWVHGGSRTDLGRVSESGDGGSKRVELALAEDSNPAYVWFRTRCRRCTEMERKLAVSLSLETDRGTTQLFTDGRLRDARRQFGSGARLPGRLSPGDTWHVVVDWALQEPLEQDGTVNFDFDFHATQARNVDDPAAFGPAWTCPDGCADDAPAVSDVSWVGFCAGSGEQLRPDDVTFSVDGHVLEVTDAPADLDAILLKYGTNLDVFENPAPVGSFAAGTGDETYTQQRSGFRGTTRSNPTPCPGTCGLKYDVDEGSFERNGCES